MVGSRIGAGAGHPLQVRQDVGILLEALPVGSLAGTDDGGVVFRAQPVSYVVVEHGVNIVFPLFKRF